MASKRAASRRITLPANLVDAIESYLSTPWSDGRDPSKIGALNAVAFIGERVAAIFSVKRSRATRVARAKGGR